MITIFTIIIIMFHVTLFTILPLVMTILPLVMTILPLVMTILMGSVVVQYAKSGLVLKVAVWGVQMQERLLGSAARLHCL